MASCRLSDSAAGPADARMGAYFSGIHHPQQALPPRIGYVAIMDQRVAGYIAGHLTTRHGCAAEVQYLFVEPAARRKAVATRLLRLLASWFVENGAQRVCVCLDADSPSARPFYEAVHAVQLSETHRLWFVWNDIGKVLSLPKGDPE
jgi:GNAT superfamily N-acetyltransferase